MVNKMISLEKFVEKYKGQRVDVPWGYKGQCVSLVQRYLNECLGYDLHPRGNAKDWVNTLINEGIAYQVSGTAQRGDIIVYGSNYGGGYGHIAIALGNGKMFDQNNTSHDNGCAGITNIFGRYTIMRTYRQAPSEDKPEPKIRYQAQLEDYGWQEWKSDGEMAGTMRQSKRLEALRIDYKGEVYAKAHLQDIGWIDYGKINKDTIIGTVGESRRLECLCLKGNFKYRVHIEGMIGFTPWTDADGVCTQGTVGQGLRIEAIEIKEK